jgi:hypothetical protein
MLMYASFVAHQFYFLASSFVFATVSYFCCTYYQFIRPTSVYFSPAQKFKVADLDERAKDRGRYLHTWIRNDGTLVLTI